MISQNAFHLTKSSSMGTRFSSLMCTGLLAIAPLFAGADKIRVVPTPQYLEPLARQIQVAAGGTIQIDTQPPSVATNPRLWLAADFLERQVRENAPRVRVVKNNHSGETLNASIHLWDYSTSSAPPAPLNFLDQAVLSDPNHYGQSYVIRTGNSNSLWVIGSTDQAVLLGAMTVLQLMHPLSGGLLLDEVYIRDYPEFEFRASSDWLLFPEINGWSLDRGQGEEVFASLCERKLDQALRFKVNMVFMDGFGWGLKQRFPGYGQLMRRLNRYARARGIGLIFGGYGAAYDLREEYHGEVFENRQSYPNGQIYQCPGQPERGPGPGHGTCRSNEVLNRLKAEELVRFVAAVEPGALFIHHEDCCGYDVYQEIWKQRCAQCRRRWPNDSLKAYDGGAGAFAHSYSNLIEAVNRVTNASTGYDASRNSQIILCSPVYSPISPSSEDWSDALELWRNVALQLPKKDNVQICFREVFPQKYGATRWTSVFNATLRREGLNFGVFLFYLSGGTDYITDAPWSAGPSMNRLFLGARSIYNFSGDFYREPMQIVNAEYAWNTRSTGFYHDPQRYDEAWKLWQEYVYNGRRPPEIFGDEGIFQVACKLLYGEKAGKIMRSYYQESAWIPEDGVPEKGYLPGRTYHPRVYALPLHWRQLREDQETWEIDAGTPSGKLPREELHRRLARRWRILGDLNEKGARYIDAALDAGPSAESREDLKFLQTSFRVYKPLLIALERFHLALQSHFGKSHNVSERASLLRSALSMARTANVEAERAFPHPIDPSGGEIGALRESARQLVETIEKVSRRLGDQAATEPARQQTRIPRAAWSVADNAISRARIYAGRGGF